MLILGGFMGVCSYYLNRNQASLLRHPYPGTHSGRLIFNVPRAVYTVSGRFCGIALSQMRNQCVASLLHLGVRTPARAIASG